MKSVDLPPLYLLLASMSRYRAECLSKIDLPFAQWAPHIDETPLENEQPADLVCRLAGLKAQAGLKAINGDADIARKSEVSHILASDQVMALGQTILGKPHTMDKAKEQLRSMSGQTVYFYTSLCVLDTNTNESRITLDKTKVTFRDLTDEQIELYLNFEQPLDCAGSFKSEKAGILLCKGIEGKDPNALVGLPLVSLTDSLAALGYQLPTSNKIV